MSQIILNYDLGLKQQTTFSPIKITSIGVLQAEIVADLVGDIGSSVVSNLTEAAVGSIIGSGSGNTGPNDRPQISTVTPILNMSSFQMKTGENNTMIENSQYLAYGKSDVASSKHTSIGALLGKKILLSSFDQKVSDGPGTILYESEIGLDPNRDQQLPGIVRSTPPFSAIGQFFEAFKFDAIEYTVVPVATAFHKSTLILSAALGTTAPQSLQQVNNQMATTIELDGSGTPQTLSIPYASPYPYLLTPKGLYNSHYRGTVSQAGSDFFRYIMGKIQATVATNLTANADVVSQTVTYLLYIQFKGLEFLLPNGMQNTPLYRNPTEDLDALHLTFEPEKVSVRGRPQSGISNNNLIIGSSKSKETTVHTHIGGIPANTFSDYARRENYTHWLTINQLTPVGRLASFNFNELLSNQARRAFEQFVFVDFSEAHLIIKAIVQGNPTVNGAIMSNFVPLTSAIEATYVQTSPMAMCMVDNAVLTQLNGINSFEIDVDLSTIVGGAAYCNQLDKPEFTPGCFQMNVVAPYRTGSVASPDAITVLISTRLENVKFSTPIIAPDVNTIDGTAPAFERMKVSNKGSLQAAVSTDEKLADVVVSEQGGAPTPGITQTTSITSDNIDKALMNSWFPVCQFVGEESATPGIMKGVLAPFYLGYSDVMSGLQLNTATGYPKFKNMSIPPGLAQQNPTGYTDGQCAFMRPHPASMLSQFFRIAKCDVSFSIKMTTRSGQGNYILEVYYNPDLLQEGGPNFETPHQVPGQAFSSGITSCAIARVVIGNDKWTNVTIPATSMIGSVKTPTSPSDYSNIVYNPWVMRISPQVRFGNEAGHCVPAPQPTYEFGDWNGKVLLDLDLITMEIYMRLGENSTFSIPVGLPQIWETPFMQQGKYTSGAAIVSVPSKFRILPETGNAPNFSAAITQEEIVDYRSKYTVDPVSLDGSDQGYWDSLKLRSFLVDYEAVPRSVLGMWLGLNINPTDILVGDGSIMIIEERDPVLKVPENVPVEVTGFSGAGATSYGFTVNVFDHESLVYSAPGTNNLYAPRLTLNGLAYKYPLYVATLPAPYRTYKMIPTGAMSNNSHTLPLEGKAWAPIPDSNLEISQVFSEGLVEIGLLRGTVHFVEPASKFLGGEEEVDIVPVEGKLQSFAHEIVQVEGHLQAKNSSKSSKDSELKHVRNNDRQPALAVGDSEGKTGCGSYSTDDGDDEDGDDDDDADGNGGSIAGSTYETGEELKELDDYLEPEDESDKPKKREAIATSAYRMFSKFMEKNCPAEAIKKIKKQFKEFFSNPLGTISSVITKICTFVKEQIATLRGKVVSFSIKNMASSYYDYLCNAIKEVPVFIIYIVALFLITEVVKSEWVTSMLAFIIQPLVKLCQTVGSTVATCTGMMNKWFSDSVDVVKRAYMGKSANISTNVSKDLGDFMKAVENDEKGSDPVVIPDSFGSKISHWFSVLVHYFTRNVTFSAMQDALGKGVAVAASAVALIMWIEKRLTAGQRLVGIFSRLAPTYYEYVSGLCARNVDPALDPIKPQITFCTYFLNLDKSGNEAKERSDKFRQDYRAIKHFWDMRYMKLNPTTSQYIKALLNEIKSVLGSLPTGSKKSGYRVKTLCVVLKGAPGIGKGYMLNTLAGFLADPDDIAYMNLSGVDFRIESTMYSGQSLVVSSEILTVDTPEAHSSFITFVNTLVDNAPNIAFSATANDKGNVNFIPHYLLTTTNTSFDQALKGAVDINSTLRRLLILKVMVDPEYQLNDGSVDWQKVKRDGLSDGAHLRFYPQVAARGRKPRANGLPESEHAKSATVNPLVLTGREIDNTSVKGHNGVMCKPEMNLREVIEYIMACRQVNVNDYNLTLKNMKLGSTLGRSFKDDFGKLLSSTKSCGRSMVKDVVIRAIQQEAAIHGMDPEHAHKLFINHQIEHKFTLDREQGELNFMATYSEIVCIASTENDLASFKLRLEDKHLAYLMMNIRQTFLEMDDYEETKREDEEFRQIITAILEDRSFRDAYILHGMRCQEVDITLGKGMYLKFSIKRDDGTPKNLKFRADVVDKIRSRLFRLAALASNGELQECELTDEKYEPMKTTRSFGICSPFTHKFWCVSGVNCNSDCRVAPVSNIMELAARNPLKTLAIGAACFKIFMNVVDITKTMSDIFSGILLTDVPENSEFIGGKIDPFGSSSKTVSFKNAPIDYVFILRPNEETVLSPADVLDAILEWSRDKTLAGPYESLAKSFIYDWSKTLGLNPSDLVEGFAVVDLRTLNLHCSCCPRTFMEKLNSPLMIYGKPCVTNFFEHYIERLMVLSTEKIDDIIDLVEVESGRLQYNTGSNRVRRTVDRRRNIRPKPDEPVKVKGRLQATNSNPVHDKRFKDIMSRVYDLRVTPENTQRTSRVSALALGLNCFLTVGHAFGPPTTYRNYSTVENGVNPLVKRADIDLTDPDNLTVSLTVVDEQLTRIKSINGHHSQDALIVNLGSGKTVSKANLFLKREKFLGRLTFQDVTLVNPILGNINVGTVQIRPDLASELKSQSHRYVHDGIILYNELSNLDGYCGSPYVAFFEGNYSIIGIHVASAKFEKEVQMIEPGPKSVGVLLSKEVVNAALPKEQSGLSIAKPLPNYTLPPEMEDIKACDPGFESITRLSVAKSFQDYYDGKTPSAQYVGETKAKAFPRGKTALIPSLINGLTGKGHLHAPAFQGDENVTAQDVAELGLARSVTYRNKMPAPGYNKFNEHARNIFVVNPPDNPIKTRLSRIEAINGGYADCSFVNTYDWAGSCFSNTEMDCEGADFSSGKLEIKPIDRSSAAGMNGLKQRDFLKQVEFQNRRGETILLYDIDTSTVHGSQALALLKRTEVELLEGKSVWIAFDVCLKDEALLIKKLKEWLIDIFPEVRELPKGGKTRIFTVVYWVYNLLLKMYTAPALTYIKSLKGLINFASGFNCYSPEWEKIFSHFDSVNDSEVSFLAADVSDQESFIDSATVGGLCRLMSIVYDVQDTIWVKTCPRNATWNTYINTIKNDKETPALLRAARDAIVNSVCPSLNTIGSSVYFASARNQSGSYLTSMLSYYSSAASEYYCLDKGLKLINHLQRKLGRATLESPATMSDRFGLFSGDDQIICYSKRMKTMLTLGNKLLAEIPLLERRAYPVPIVIGDDLDESLHVGSFIRAITLFYAGIEMVDPDTGGVPQLVTEDQAPFLGNLTQVNPELTEEIVSKGGPQVHKFAVLETSRTYKCLNWVRVSEHSCPAAALVQNANTMLELTFTRGREAYDISRGNLGSWLREVGITSPLLTFTQCVDRFIDRDYTLGDEANIFPLI